MCSSDLWREARQRCGDLVRTADAHAGDHETAVGAGDGLVGCARGRVHGGDRRARDDTALRVLGDARRLGAIVGREIAVPGAADGKLELRRVVAWDAETEVATLDRPWGTAPEAGTRLRVFVPSASTISQLHGSFRDVPA